MDKVRRLAGILSGILLIPLFACCAGDSERFDHTEESSMESETDQESRSDLSWETEPSADNERDVVAYSKSINNRTENGIKKAAVETAVIFDPQDGDWTFSHGPNIVYFKGKFYVTYSSGVKNEDDCGQRVMISSSEDGIVWSKPEVLLDSIQGEHSLCVLQASGLTASDEVMTAFMTCGEYEKESLRAPNLRPLEDGTKNKYGLYMTTTDGVNWEPAEKMTFLLYRPQQISSGRWIGMGPTLFPYTDDKNCNDMNSFRFAAVYLGNIKRYDGKISMVTESKMYEAADGILHMFYRTNTGVMWHSESYNSGFDWTEPYPTSFTNDGSMFEFGTLPDGRIFCVGNPTVGSGRNPLVLSLSENGVDFDDQYILRDEPYTLKYEGMYKGGVYAYPDTIVVGDYLYAVYSVHKEGISVTRISLASLR